MPSREEPAPEEREGKGERDLDEDSGIGVVEDLEVRTVEAAGRDRAFDREASQLAGDTRCQPTESLGT